MGEFQCPFTDVFESHAALLLPVRTLEAWLTRPRHRLADLALIRYLPEGSQSLLRSAKVPMVR